MARGGAKANLARMSDALTHTLRDHARGAVRAEVLRRAWDLFAEQGFEATTIDQVAEAAGMSRRTFFRYFDGKDALVLTSLVEAGERVAAALAGRPPDEPAWTALRTAFEESVRVTETDERRSRSLHLMLGTEPALAATLQVRRRRWLELLAPLVALRIEADPGDPGDLGATAVASSALACLEVAQARWAEHEGARLGDLLDLGMNAVSPLRPTEDGSAG